MQVNNAMDDLIRAVRESTDPNRAARINRRAARDIGETMLRALRANQPTRTNPPPEEPPRHTREEHVSISDGWRTPQTGADTRSGSSAVGIGNLSGHIDVMRTGRRPYTVFAWQSFWLSPDRARDPVLRRNMAKRVEAGHNPIVRMLYTRRRDKMPPWGGEDFVAKSARQSLPRRFGTFVRAEQEIVGRPLKEFFGG